jgi:predicted ATPase
MARLIVKNVGPIKDVDIELKKVNVFMGPQGCGKSTLAKIISFSSWLEKGNEDTDKVKKNGLISTLIRYHRMEGYFHSDTQIAYLGENVCWYYQFPQPLPVSWKGFTPERVYNDNEFVIYYTEKSINPKVIYIPAERNFVSVVPNLQKYAEQDDSLQSFVNDWFEAKRAYTEKKSLKIEMLDIEYYYNAKTDNDIIKVNGQKTQLSQSSSGYQSVVPLMALLSYLSSEIYKENKPFSPAENAQMQEILSHVSNEASGEMEQKVIDRIRGFLQGKVYSHTQFIIEEPEQNLFPNTQCDLMYHLLNCLNHGKAHRAVITTHSPYILYALNNCMLASIIRETISADELEELQVECANVFIHSKDVAVWEIENGSMKTYTKDAKNSTIQDKDGLIRKNFFNNVMGKVMSDFNNLLMFKD